MPPASSTTADATIRADAPNNVLIIKAHAPVHDQTRAAIERLDTRRAQILVAARIVGVAPDHPAECGIQ